MVFLRQNLNLDILVIFKMMLTNNFIKYSLQGKSGSHIWKNHTDNFEGKFSFTV